MIAGLVLPGKKGGGTAENWRRRSLPLCRVPGRAALPAEQRWANPAAGPAGAEVTEENQAQLPLNRLHLAWWHRNLTRWEGVVSRPRRLTVGDGKSYSSG